MSSADHDRHNYRPARGRAADLTAALDRLRGDRALLAELIRCFDEDCAKLLNQVCEAADRGDFEKLRSSAHSLKGLAANFDAQPTVVLAAQLEHAAQENDLDNAATLIPRLRTAAGELGQELDAFMAEEGGAKGDR